MLLQTHYKTQLNFTFTGLDAVKGSLQRLQDFIFRLQHISTDNDSGLVSPVIERAYVAFAAALADDLNISSALAAVFEMVAKSMLFAMQTRSAGPKRNTYLLF